MAPHNIGLRVQKMMHPATAPPSLTALVKLLKLLGVAAVYALTSWLLESHFIPDGGETTFFLPSGLALAAVLLGGRRYTEAVALGALAGNLLFGNPFVASALMALATAAAALLGAWLVRRSGKFDPALARTSDVMRLWFFGGFVASTLSAVLGTTALLLTGLVRPEAVAVNMAEWWMGDTTGVVLVAPLVLVWWPVLSRRWSCPSARLLTEYALILGVTALVSGSVYLGWPQPVAVAKSQYFTSALAQGYWVFLVIVWASLRLGLRGASLALLLVAFVSQLGLRGNLGLYGSSPDDLAQMVNVWLHTIVLSVIGVVLGILVTANKSTTQALRHNESILTKDLHNIMTAVNHHSIVTISDALGRITWANAKCCKTTGYSAAELVGQGYKLFRSGVHPEGFFKNLYATVNAGHIWQGELCNRVKDGRLVWVQTTITPVIGDNGKPDKYIHISTDVSEDKRLEALAQAGDTAKSEFLANMSHEIRTPLNGVIGMVDILQQSELTPPQQRMLDTVQKSSLALLTIVNDILDFSKIDSGKLEIEHIAFSLRELAEGTAQLVAATAAAKSVDLCLFVSPELPACVLADPSRLRQVLLNLLGNAVKFTHGTSDQDARVVFLVEPCNLRQGGAGIKLRISDNGIGMSAETQKKLFHAFVQADDSTSRKFGGSGLGLSICKQLVELMGGRIFVTSVLGKGSEFTVEIPLHPAPARPLPVLATRLEGVHVFAVTENSLLAATVSSYCRDAGATVTVLPYLAAARHRLQKQSDNAANSVVLLDSELDSGLSDLPKNTPLVRMIKQSDLDNLSAVAISICPLIYDELIHCVALASGRLVLPVKPPPTTPADQAFSAPLAANKVAASGQLILLAEDNETNRDVIQAQLQLLGYASEAAVDGLGALAMWRSNRFALLLTDCHMPNMDGFALTAAIRREEPAGSRFPIVAVTASAMQDEAARCRQRGMDDYISKPLRLEDLAPILKKWLPEPSLQAQALLRATRQAALPDLLATWDASTLTLVVGSNPALHFKLLTKFLINAAQQVSTMRLAVEDGKRHQAADIAHALKSSSRMVGALMLGELCERLETAAEAQNLAACTALAPQIQAMFFLTRESIAQHVAPLELV